MRATKPRFYFWLFAVATVFMMSPVVLAQSYRIVLSSDREEMDLEHDVWLSNDDGSQQVLFSKAPDEMFTDQRRRPSICNDGQWIFYDHFSGGPEFVGDLWVKPTKSGGQPQKAFHCTNPAASPWCFDGQLLPHCVQPTNPPPDPPLSLNECQCFDVDCGLPASAFDMPRLLFTLGDPPTSRNNIILATWDVSTETVVGACRLTSTGGSPESPEQNLDPAWCGTNHAVFSRSHEVSTGEQTICTITVPGSGATEEPVIRCHDTPDFLEERYPSCGRRDQSEVWSVAYALQKAGATDGFHRFCTIDLDENFDFIESSRVCTPIGDLTVDWTKPTWSPGGTQIAFVSNANVGFPLENDYDIYRISSDPARILAGGPVFAHPPNADGDDDPDWGPTIAGQ